MHDGERMVHKAIKFVPGLYKIFDEILVNAADNKVRDPTMDTLRVDIDPVSAAGGWSGSGSSAGPVGSMVPAGGRWGSGRAAWCASNGLANNLHAPLARCSSVAIIASVLLLPEDSTTAGICQLWGVCECHFLASCPPPLCPPCRSRAQSRC